MKKILVVDDDEDLLINMKRFFKKNGFDVTVSMSCQEAMEIFNSFTPDIVFLDINVGREDGREMCSRIKSNAEYKHIPVILISAGSYNIDFYHQYGASAFIPKPFDISKLLDSLKTYLQD